jgi:hypothetical protein
MSVRTFLLGLILLFSACTSNKWEGAYVVDKEALKLEAVKAMEGNALASTLGTAMISKLLDNTNFFMVIDGDSIFSAGSLGNEPGEFFASTYTSDENGLVFTNKKGEQLRLIKNDTSFTLSNSKESETPVISFNKVEKKEEQKYHERVVEIRTQFRNKEKIKKELEGIISLKITKKGYYEYKYRDYLTFDLAVGNNSEKNITAFSGFVTIADLLDNELKTFSWTYDDGIESKRTRKKSVQVDYSEYNTSETLIRDKPLEKLKITWTTTKVLFEDGNKLGE